MKLSLNSMAIATQLADFTFRSRQVRLTFLLILLLELLSFFGWAVPSLGNAVFIAVLVAVLAASLVDLRLGVAAMVAELLIGSHGYIVAFMTSGGLSVSLRIAMFLVVGSVALVKALKDRSLLVWQAPLRTPLLLMAAVILYAIGRGIQQGNGFANVFFDSNAFLFFAAAMPFWQAIRNSEDLRFLLQVAFGASVASVAKVLLLVYMFSHKLWWALPETYRWVRDTRIGELTQMTESFFRIFFQSQIYTVIAFFVVLAFLVHASFGQGLVTALRQRSSAAKLFVLSLMMASILVSLSRSNWMGMVAAFLSLPLFLRLLGRPLWSWAFRSAGYVVASMFIAIFLVAGLILVPFPPAGGGFSASLFGSRALTFKEEAGVGSRWALIGPLWQAIIQHPVLGQGFGKEVTYKTEDPRLLAQNASGEYTTFIFEWGYHDLWLKLGVFGLLAYIVLLVTLARQFIAWAKTHHQESTGWQHALVLGMTTGLVAILVTHTTSPYINHPLGISYLLLYALTLDRLVDTNVKSS